MVADVVVRGGGDLSGVAQAMGGWPGADRARWVAAHADPLAETPIETLGRYVCIRYDLPLPVSNAWVGECRPHYRVDGPWPWHRAAHEADGAVKYDNRPDASRIIAHQIERDWDLRRLGVDLARYGWDLAFLRPGELANRFCRIATGQPAAGQADAVVEARPWCRPGRTGA